MQKYFEFDLELVSIFYPSFFIPDIRNQLNMFLASIENMRIQTFFLKFLFLSVSNSQ